MQFDIFDTPFSYFGSYMSAKFEKKYDGITLKSLRGKSRSHSDVLKFIPCLHGKRVDYKISTTFDTVTFHLPEDHSLELCFYDTRHLLIRGTGAHLSLKLDTLPLYNFEYNFLLQSPNQDYCVINSYKNLTKFLVYPQNGTLTLQQALQYDSTGSADVGSNDSVIMLTPKTGETQFLAVIQDIPTHMGLPLATSISFDAAQVNAKNTFERFWEKQRPVADEYRTTAKLAAYINWSSTVQAEGYLRRPTMWASNNNFLGAWSWDHAFNALALAGVDNQLAYDQMATLFDYQDEHGQIPGSVSDSTLRWNFAKPPVHGLFFHKMMNFIDYTPEQLQEMYTWISKQVSFYFTFKDANLDGICEYHHGNDSGQDNSTVFASGVVIDSPDLTAFLICDLDFLHEIALKLNLKTEAAQWKAQADHLTERFIAHFIVDGLPVAKSSFTGEIIESNALLPYVSLILGTRLPADIRHKMITKLTSPQFLTAYGIATEAIDSPDYQADAYWRGPIWAPSTLLIVEALEACGEQTLALDIAKRYCDMLTTQAIAENFDAQTGVALRDKSFTWTASTFLYLAAKLFDAQ